MDAAGDLIVGRVYERPVPPPPQLDDSPLYQHALLCQLGFPRSKVTGPLFERRSGAASLLIEGGPWHTGTAWEMQPVPYGVIPRLAFMNICREAKRTGSPVIDVKPSARHYARELGLSEGGKAMERFRRQVIALWCCRMHLGFVTVGGQGQAKVEPFEAFRVTDAEKGAWPRRIEINQQLMGSLVQHAVALEPSAVRALQGSALALDVYAWLAHRLCRITEPHGVDISWWALKQQFGHEYKTVKDFRHDFVAALLNVLPVYPEASVEVMRGQGLRLMASPEPSIGQATRAYRLAGRKTRAVEPPRQHGVEFADEAAPGAFAVADVVDPVDDRASESPAVWSDILGRMRVRFGDTVFQRWLSCMTVKSWGDEVVLALPTRFLVDWVERDYADKLLALIREGDGNVMRLRLIVDPTAPSNVAGEKGEQRAAVEDAVSDWHGSRLKPETIDLARSLLPGQDVADLVRRFFAWNAERGEVVRKPDAAFIGWVRSISKSSKVN